MYNIKLDLNKESELTYVAASTVKMFELDPHLFSMVPDGPQMLFKEGLALYPDQDETDLRTEI